MDQVVVKTEMQCNEEILLFYVDENGGNEEGIVTTIENIDAVPDNAMQQTVYIHENIDDPITEANAEIIYDEDMWTEFEIQRLLVFYIDNKESFLTGTTKSSFLWSVACKTMLAGKTPDLCELKLSNLKKKYCDDIIQNMKGIPSTWQLFDLGHQAFHDDSNVVRMLQDLTPIPEQTIEPEIENAVEPENGMVVTKKLSTRSNADEKVVALLKSYIKHKNALRNVKKDTWQKGLWDTIALEMGEDDAEYWRKRFLNFKHNYVRLLDKRKENGPESINWPYMHLFDQIFGDDEEFQRKYKVEPITEPKSAETTTEVLEMDNYWNTAEVTVLVKYYFDCFDEFQDPTIPNSFLWNEVGRLLDRKPDACKVKYLELKTTHFEKHIERSGPYDVGHRNAVEILFDNIIAKETEIILCKGIKSNKPSKADIWKTEDVDSLVQFFYDHLEMFKDPILYYVCWAVVSKILKHTILNCRKQWEELVILYTSILDDKKENAEMQIDWRYIELFDRLFDYGMDKKLLLGYEKLQPQLEEREEGAKKNNKGEQDLDDEDYDEAGTKKGTGHQKAFKILEFYLKNKQKFSTTRKKALWAILGKQIGISAAQCAHRFRNLKQVYTGYVQREMNKPEMPITWPYYQLCKKVFGYRAMRNKLKNSKADSDDSEEWSSKEIKQLITYFSKRFKDIDDNYKENYVWSELANEISKSENACREKFLELRKSYRKLKTMKARNPSVKVTWKYFNMVDEVYRLQENGGSENMDFDNYELLPVFDDITEELQNDDDVQCIIVIPEGQDLSDLSNAKIIITDKNQTMEAETTEEKPKITPKWTKKTKKRLLILYLKYIKAHKDEEIIASDMWKEIASQLPDKTTLSCRKMFARLKKNRLNITDSKEVSKKTPYYAVLEKILAIQPKFKKLSKIKTDLEDEKVYSDVPMADDKVKQALEFYLENLEEFVSPQYEKKYAWSNVAKLIDEPVKKVFNKINYLKNNHSEVVDENVQHKPYNGILNEIIVKEAMIKYTSNQENNDEGNNSEEVIWSDDEVEQLLIWYLANLEKFKNPKFARKYLWIESSNILGKSPLACSKKMSEIRTTYRTMVKETPDELSDWRFSDLCLKIYGTGKQKVFD